MENRKLLDFKESLKGKRVAVIGVGVSNTPLIRVLLSAGAKVTACDKKSPEELGANYERFREMGVDFQLGEDYLDHLDQPMIFKTPGLRGDHPKLLEAAARGSVVTSEMEVFFDLCPAEIIAVTGSDGKTTTTSLIYAMLTKGGYTCWLGGNIGNSLIGELEDIKPSDKVVLELSSFQLMSMKKSADIAVITNITPNHLDWHKDMAEYVDAKRNIFAHQGENGRLVLNKDSEASLAYADNAPGQVVYFGRQTPGDVALKNGVIVVNEGKKPREVLNASDIFIPGNHNIENYMAAIAAIWGMVDKDIISEVARTFQGVEHRIEYVRELDGARYYNDSIASSPTRTEAGLNSFNQKVILIAGGYDKHIPFDDFGKVVIEHVKHLVLIGKTAYEIERAVLGAAGQVEAPPVVHCETLEEAVLAARKAAEEGDIVMLSPACASFDMFKNFDERGKKFKEIVNGL